MKPDPTTRRGRLTLALGARLLRFIVLALTRTCRVEVAAGKEHFEEVFATRRPVIPSFWHNRVFLAAPYLFRQMLPRGMDVTVLASQSRDGELVTLLAGLWRLRTVRGSASRGGSAALRGTYRAIVKHQSSPVMIPDGPRGPLYRFKIGVAVLSQMAETPILPIGLAASRFWRIKSWDRIIIPKPFARIVLVVGSPQTVPRDLNEEALEAERQRLETLLDRLTLDAEARLGVEDEMRGQGEDAVAPPAGPAPGTAADPDGRQQIH